METDSIHIYSIGLLASLNRRRGKEKNIQMLSAAMTLPLTACGSVGNSKQVWKHYPNHREKGVHERMAVPPDTDVYLE